MMVEDLDHHVLERIGKSDLINLTALLKGMDFFLKVNIRRILIFNMLFKWFKNTRKPIGPSVEEAQNESMETQGFKSGIGINVLLVGEVAEIIDKSPEATLEVIRSWMYQKR